MVGRVGRRLAPNGEERQVDEAGPPLLEHRAVAGDMIRHLAARFGDHDLAVLGDLRLTYAEAERRSAALARGLLASGVGKGSRLGLLAPNGPDWIVAWLAGARIGAVVSLLNTYSPAPELDWALRHSDTAVLLTAAEHLGHSHLDRVEGAVDGLASSDHEQIRTPSHPYLRSVWVLGPCDRAWAGSVEDLASRADGIDEDLLRAVEAQVDPADPMVVVYSSGSTSDPKGAVHSQGAVVRHGANLSRFRPLEEGDRIYTPMPLFWVGGLSFALIRSMHAGATLVMEERFEPGATLALLERERVTHVLGWPHMGPALMGHPDFASRDLSSLRGGSLPELLPPERRPADPGLLAGSLGMTETLGPHLIDREGEVLPESKRGSFGRSVPGVEHRIVGEDGVDVGPGEHGEIWVRGYSLMLGLHKRERAEVFTPDGWYRTGDGAHCDQDGHVYFTGRLGDLIKSAGMNISPREVEAVLDGLDEVVRSIVVGIPAGARGEDVAAAVVVRSAVDPGELLARAKEHLSAYKVPRHLAVFTDDDQLPWLDSGKVDRRGVAELLAKRAGRRED
jgi:acyl-CoA synthetase (AMP-forming)/AMP-acid ligase II